MTALAEYLLKANLCLAGFYALYYLLLRRHTFFGLNRAYLLVAMLASFGLPLIALPEPVVETVSLPVINLPVATVTTQPTGPTLENVVLIGYGLGALLFLTLLAVSLWRLVVLIRRGDVTRQADHTLVVLTDAQVAPFSFFRYLVLNQADFAQHAEPIIRHELVHIRQWHSVDVILAELVKVVCWLNPVAWLYKQSLQQVHEYLADQQAADKAQYARFLFDYAFQTEPSPVANSFFTPALLTQRIRMLYQSRNTRRALWKYALLLPLLAVLIGLTAAREPMTRLMQANQQTSDVGLDGFVSGPNRKPLAGAHVVILNTNRGTETDGRGYFKLTDVPNTASLVISFMGCKSVQIPVEGRNVTFVIALTAETTKLPEVTVEETAKTATGNVLTSPVSTTTPPNEIFTVVEQSPEFPGGMVALGQYLGTNIRYPAEARQQHTEGRVFVQFVVEADGSIQSPRVLKGIGNGCDEEAVRVVSTMPKWKPGKQNGRPVNVQFNLPIQFKLADSQSPALKSTTLTDEKPLIVIDGKEQIKGDTLNTIKPDNIQNINVLKGPSAQGKYGEKGKNGVIEITTRPK